MLQHHTWAELTALASLNIALAEVASSGRICSKIACIRIFLGIGPPFAGLNSPLLTFVERRDGAGYAGGAGFEGMGFVNPTNAAGDTITFTLSGCKAGAFDLGFQYALASGSRSMGLSVNGIDQTAVRFPATGGWLADDWREIFTTVQLTTGRNLVTLSTTGDEGPNLDSLEVTAKNNRVNT